VIQSRIRVSLSVYFARSGCIQLGELVGNKARVANFAIGLESSRELVGSFVGNPGFQLVCSFQLVRLVECGCGANYDGCAGAFYGTYYVEIVQCSVS